MASGDNIFRHPGRFSEHWYGSNTFTKFSQSKNSSDVSNSNLHFYSFAVGPLQCNCTIVFDTTTREAVLVDPGGDVDEIINRIEALKARLVQVITTHGHLDHFLAAGDLKKRYPAAQLILNKDDLFLWNKCESQAKMMLGPKFPVTVPPAPDVFATDDMDIKCNGKIITTPGHSPGSICVLFEQEKTLMSCDTLFFLNIGRTGTVSLSLSLSLSPTLSSLFMSHSPLRRSMGRRLQHDQKVHLQAVQHHQRRNICCPGCSFVCLHSVMPPSLTLCGKAMASTR